MHLESNRRHSFNRLLAAGLVFLVAMLCLSACPGPKNTASTSGRNPDLHLLVRGYLAVAIGQSAEAEKMGLYSRSLKARNFYVPGVDVFLRDTQTNADSTAVKTDLSGRFNLLAPQKGTYKLCWKSSVYGDGCAARTFAAGGEPLFVSTVLMTVPHKTDFVASLGKVRFADESLPRTLEPYSSINAFATVSLHDSQKQLLAEVPVNNFGDYLLPYLPQKEIVTLTAKIEGGEGVQVVEPDAFKRNPRIVQFHLVIQNHKPRLDPIVPVSVATGKRVQLGAPGDKVALKAVTQDRDGDTVKVAWSVAQDNGLLSANTGNQIEWTLPTQPGLYSVLAIASDGKGGYERYPVQLSVGATGVAFSGTVAATDGTLVNGAEVEINGSKQITDAQGRFTSYVPEQERYVFNIRKLGYGFYSKIYDRTVTGGRWTLIAASVTTFDPTLPFDFQDKRSARNCVGPQAARINWDEGPVLKQVWWQDGKGNNVPPPIESNDRKNAKLRAVLPWDKRNRQDGCGPGIAVKIPANALEKVGGGAPVGNVTLSLSTVDLNSPGQMPGDDGVERSGTNVTAWMESYGAGSVQLEDSTGAPLQLKSGAQADLVIPVDPVQLQAGGTLPATAPRLYYDEVKGIWRQDGVLTLDAAKKNYVAKVKHFSSQNTDLVFNDPSCIRVLSTITPPYDVEITIPRAGAAPQQKVMHVTTAPPHVIYHLPNGVPVTLVAIAPGSGSTPPRSLGVFIVDSGPKQASGYGSPPPASACSSEVTLSVKTFPVGGEFLHGLDSFAASAMNEADIGVLGTLSDNLDKATQNYYNAVDPVTDAVNKPNGDRTTLVDFKAVNGFTANGFTLCSGVPCADPDVEINTAYANSGDLGFGRDMHCRRHGTAPNYNYACYVTNYGFGGVANPANGVLANTADEQDANDAAANNGVVATVAMEYSPIAGDATGDRVVKFFVYNAAGNRVNNADLDGHGRRPVPQLCMVCHGGAYAAPNTGVPGFEPPNAVNKVKLGSRFLPFDMHLFTYPTSPNKNAQQAAFKRLNEDIVRHAPALPGADPVGAVVTAMYQGSSTQIEEFTVPLWQQTAQPKTVVQENFYKRVFGNACRTCHVAQPFATLQFASAEQFIRDGYLGTAETRVCEEHVMPHASRTHDIFWGQYWENSFGPFNPTLVGQFQVFGDAMKTLPPPSGWSGTWVAPQWNGQKCGTYVTPGSTPASQYSDFVHPLWSRNYSTNGGTARCSGCHSELSGLAADTRNQLLTTSFGPSGSNAVTANDLNSPLVQIVNGPFSGTPRMPYNCPNSNRRCLNETGTYDVTTDITPSATASEINRIEYWVTHGATP